MSGWWMRHVDAIAEWTLRHKWAYRTIVVTVYALLIAAHVLGMDGVWDVVFLVAYSLLLLAMAWMWWRQDAIDEFAERTRAAIGSDANIMILTARLQLRTSSIWKLNRVMRRYDIMNVPALDLPPEAKELRGILESQRTK